MFQYIEKPSFIHSLNPMIKFLGITIAVLILTLLFRPLPTLFMALLALFMLLVLARIPPGALLKSTVPFLGLAVGLAWINIAFSRHNDAPLIAWGIIRVTDTSLQIGSTLGLRVLAIMLFSYLFSATTDPRDLVLSMVQQARLPYKLAFGLFAGVRFLPLLHTEFATIQAAQRIRGMDEPRGWGGRLQMIIRLTIPLFALVVRKAGHIGIAMESRGFGAYDDRTYLHETHVTWRDGVFLVGLVGVLTVALFVFMKIGYITHIGPLSFG